MKIISRKEAEEQGLTRYYTGKPCPKGHDSERRVSGRGCCECARIQHRDWVSRNKDKKSEYDKKYKSSPEVKVRISEMNKALYERNIDEIKRKKTEYRAKNRERLNSINAQWRADNPDKMYAYRKKWSTENSDKVKAHTVNQKAVRRAAPGKCTKKDLRLIMNQQGGSCNGCGTNLDDGYHVDHIVPIAMGGSNWPRNLQMLCPPCNLFKGAKHPLVWADQIGIELHVPQEELAVIQSTHNSDQDTCQ